MPHWLDKYINKENLTQEQLKYMHCYPIQMLAYGMKDNSDYEHIWGSTALFQKMSGRNYTKDVFYIIDKTSLTKWQKFKIKFAYTFL